MRTNNILKYDVSFITIGVLYKFFFLFFLKERMLVFNGYVISIFLATASRSKIQHWLYKNIKLTLYVFFNDDVS